MARQHTALPAVTLADGTSAVMLEAEFGTPRGVTFQKYDVCRICGFTYPKSQLVYIGGAPYCTRFQDYLEAEDR
jgi:hypothetical protein